ncbi:MAG: DUF485 domain-containing protein [Candidatus Eremiobacteraeota bacterium]|nr:DUF485 domain-containing protein [Candidatus Eremiobacteraeota bacterium]
MAQALGNCLTAQRVLTQSEWERLENDPDFQALSYSKMHFIVPATIFFIIYYFALPVSVGYFSGLMETRVIGSINLAYLFALSEFVMAWVLTGMYVRRARTWDEKAAGIVAKVKGASAL